MSILIKNAFIYDGRGQPPFKKDILIRGDKVAGLGEFDKSKADEVINAEGGIVIPGFIDTGSRLDHNLQIFTDPCHQSFITQGVTTAIGGNGGSSLAPIIGNSLEEIERWGSEPSGKINIDWQSFHEFLQTLKKSGLGINFGSLAGHASIKRSLTAGEPRDLTESELELFRKILKKSFKEGALGLSIDFQGYSRRTPKEEIEFLAGITAENDKIYATSLKNPIKNPVGSLDEIIKLTESVNANTEINGLMPLKSATLGYKRVKEKIEKEALKQKMNFDCQPYPYTKIPIHYFLPNWLRESDIGRTVELVSSGRHDREIMEHLKNCAGKEIIIDEVPKELEVLRNKRIGEIAQNRSQSKTETLLEIMKTSRLKAVCLFNNVNEEALEELMLSNVSLIASGGIGFKSNRQPFLEFINWTKKNTKMPLEKAVMKTSSLPALKFGIKKRGIIRENYHADLVIIKNEDISAVVINGRVAFRDGKIEECGAGKIIQ